MDLEPGQPKSLTAASPPRGQDMSSALQAHVSICEPLVDAEGAVCTWYVGGTHGPRRAGVPDRADLRARASHDRRALTSTRRRLNRRRCGGCDLEIADPEIAGISEIQPHFLVQICIECCRVNIAADSRYNLIENQVSN